MSKCISSHGEYSEHEPGDPCPWCGEYDTERIIAERDTAEARIKAVRDVHGRSEQARTVPRMYRENPDDQSAHRHCIECGDTWPCATIRALDGGTDGDPTRSCGRGPCCLGHGHAGACHL